MKIRYDIRQNTIEWEVLKYGKFSASSCAELLMDKKTKGYTGLINRIVEERITGKQTESKTFKGNQFTERGHEFEPEARNDYELRHLTNIVQCGVIELSEWALCSPDGLINSDGLYQAKCPIFNTQKEYLMLINGMNDNSDNEILYKISSVYYKQIQFELLVSKREYSIFNSYHPNLTAIDLTIEPDKKMIEQIYVRLIEAKSEVNKQIKMLASL
jgi:hypothetical protein